MVRTVLLALHLAGMAAWLGANFLQLAVTRFYAHQPTEARLAWVRATGLLATRYYNAAGALIGVTGVNLVLHGHWSWSSGFIWVGVAVLVIGGAMGAGGFVPTSARLAEALRAEQADTVRRLDRRVLVLAIVDTAFVLTAVLAMVHKWQA
jgi:hypothetical protein